MSFDITGRVGIISDRSTVVCLLFIFMHSRTRLIFYMRTPYNCYSVTEMNRVGSFKYSKYSLTLRNEVLLVSYTKC